MFPLCQAAATHYKSAVNVIALNIKTTRTKFRILWDYRNAVEVYSNYYVL